jgi:hypothetical protein
VIYSSRFLSFGKYSLKATFDDVILKILSWQT